MLTKRITYSWTAPDGERRVIEYRFEWGEKDNRGERFFIENSRPTPVVTPREGKSPAGQIRVSCDGRNCFPYEVTHKLEDYTQAAADSDCTQAYTQKYTLLTHKNVSGDYTLKRPAESGHTWSDWTGSWTWDGGYQFVRECVHPVCTVK